MEHYGSWGFRWFAFPFSARDHRPGQTTSPMMHLSLSLSRVTEHDGLQDFHGQRVWRALKPSWRCWLADENGDEEQ